MVYGKEWNKLVDILEGISEDKIHMEALSGYPFHNLDIHPQAQIVESKLKLDYSTKTCYETLRGAEVLNEGLAPDKVLLVNSNNKLIYVVKTSVGIQDHGQLGGLEDDDHVQYYNSARHTKAVHDALGIDAETLDGLSSEDFAEVVHEHVEADIVDLDHNAVKIRGKSIKDQEPLDSQVLVYDSATQEWIPEAMQGGGGPTFFEVTVYPWGGLSVLTNDPTYAWTPEISACNDEWAEVGYWDCPLDSGIIESIFTNFVWAQKITNSGCGKVKWQIGDKKHADSPSYTDVTETVITEMNTSYTERGRSGIIHKIVGVPSSAPFCLRCLVKRDNGATNAICKIKSNTYLRIAMSPE